jgi:hypothetical protein
MSDETPTLYCANHPNVETSLRCNNCDKPICPRCAVLTPTGYRCKECVRSQQKTFDTAEWYDFVIAFVLAGLLAYLGSLIVFRIGFFTLFVAPIAGVIIAEIIRLAVRRRRARRLFLVAALGALLGSLPLLANLVLGGLLAGGIGYILFPLLWQGYYTFTVTSTLYYRMRGIQIR